MMEVVLSLSLSFTVSLLLFDLKKNFKYITERARVRETVVVVVVAAAALFFYLFFY